MAGMALETLAKDAMLRSLMLVAPVSASLVTCGDSSCIPRGAAFDALNYLLSHPPSKPIDEQAPPPHDMGVFAILVSVLARLTYARASFQLFLEDGSLPVGVTNSTTCGKALQTSIACDPSLQQASNTYFDANHSSVICTSACFTSLASYRASISAACSDATIEGEDIVYPSTIVADMLLFSYNTTCLKDA
jgi:hypothetical protein